MSTHWKNSLRASDSAMGGAAKDMGIGVLAGDTPMVTVFDDFNHVVPAETFGDAANWETMGWVLTDVGAPAADLISMNAAATVTERYDSCIHIFTGTADDAGGNMQLDRVAASLPATSGGGDFPHIWVAETAAGAAVNDNTTFIFACRIGLVGGAVTTTWDSKLFIGFAESADVDVLVPGDGTIDLAGGVEGPVVGFHVNEQAAVDGIAQRTFGTAMVEGTNFTRLIPAGGVSATAANGAGTVGQAVWVDLALRMDILDQSDASGNGSIRYYVRKVPRNSRDSGRWVAHTTVLRNQCPNNDVALVPTIEAVNGPTAGQDGSVFVDWWAFGVSRWSHR